MTKRDKRLIVVIVVTILGMIGLLGYGMYIKHNQTKLIQSYERQAENKIDDVSAELEQYFGKNKERNHLSLSNYHITASSTIPI